MWQGENTAGLTHSPTWSPLWKPSPPSFLILTPPSLFPLEHLTSRSPRRVASTFRPCRGVFPTSRLSSRVPFPVPGAAARREDSQSTRPHAARRVTERRQLDWRLTASLSTLNPIASVSRPGSLVFAAGPRLRTRARTSSPGPFLSAESGVVLEQKRWPPRRKNPHSSGKRSVKEDWQPVEESVFL